MISKKIFSSETALPPNMLLIKFQIIWPSGFRGKAVLEIDQ
jgi:hypothetical protein